MTINITILGTAAMIPSKERNHTAILLEHNKESVLFDCGEGTQRQLKIAKLGINRISKIFISHWHGDHVLGIPGIIQTMIRQNYSKTLIIFGPKGTKEKIKKLFEVFEFDKRNIKIKIKEIQKNGILYENKEYFVETYKLNHSVLTYGFNFVEKDKRRINLIYTKKIGIPDGPLLGKLQRGQDIIFKKKKIKVENATKIVKGKKIGYIADTKLCENCFKIAKDVDLLISEATYKTELDLKAENYKHMTVGNATEVANKSAVKKLVLIHLSGRYKDEKELEKEAKKSFKNSIAAYDFIKLKI